MKIKLPLASCVLLLPSLLLAEPTVAEPTTAAEPAASVSAEPATATPAPSSEAPAAPQIGHPAPEFSLKDTEGAEHSIAAYPGKIIVLEWNNFGCPFVKSQYQSKALPNLQERFTGSDDAVVWLTINSSSPGQQGHLEAAAYAEQAEAEGWKGSALLQDSDGKVGKLYHATTTPQIFIIDAEGNLAYAGATDDNASTDPAETAKANSYISAAIEALREGRPIAQAQTESYGCPVKYAKD